MTANFFKYIKFILKRERIVSVIWILSMVVTIGVLNAVYPGIFPTKEALLSMSMSLNTPSMVALMGPVYGLDKISPAIAFGQESLVWFAIAAIVMNIFFVNRHTRVDEELGRHEMFISLPVGRLTGSFSTLVSAFILNTAISLLSAIVIIILNIEGTTAAGAFCFSFSIGMQGFLFAAITLLAAQLFSTANGSLGFSFMLMGLFYILRASGDISGNMLSIISPMGLGLKVEAFYTDAFWPVLILFGEAIVVALFALIVNGKRDVGSGIIPAKKGRSHAGPFLKSPLGLTWQLSKKAFIIWAIALFTLSACYGTVMGELESFVENNDTIRQMIEAQGGGAFSLAEAFVPMICSIMAMLTSIPVISTINRLGTEERRGRIEQIYARHVSRDSMFWSFTMIGVIEAVVFTFLSMLGLYSTSANTGLLPFPMLIRAAFVQLPAILIMAAIAAFLIGVLPKLTIIVWALLGYSFFMIYFGRLFDIPEVIMKLSPFGNIPQLPVEKFLVTPILILSILVIVFFCIGFIGYKKRDIG